MEERRLKRRKTDPVLTKNQRIFLNRCRRRKENIVTHNQRLFKQYLENATPLCYDAISIVIEYAHPVVVLRKLLTTIDSLCEHLNWADAAFLCTSRECGENIYRKTKTGEICKAPRGWQPGTNFQDFSSRFSELFHNDELYIRYDKWFHAVHSRSLSIYCDVPYVSFVCFEDFYVMSCLCDVKRWDVNLYQAEIV